MKYGALFGWGIVIYAVMYLVSSGVLIYGAFAGAVLPFLKLAALIVILSIAGRQLRVATWQDAVPYTIGWTLIVALLDAIYWGPITSWAIYASYGTLIGYALVAIVPVIAFRFPERKAPIEIPPAPTVI